jgi:hypothetical protein
VGICYKGFERLNLLEDFKINDSPTLVYFNNKKGDCKIISFLFSEKDGQIELQINENHRQYLEAFLENFPNFNVSNFKKKKRTK